MNNAENYYNNILELMGQWFTWLKLLPIFVAWVFRKNFNPILLKFYYYLIGIFAVNIFQIVIIYTFSNHYEIFWKKWLDLLKIENIHFINIGIDFVTYFFLIQFLFSLLPKYINLNFHKPIILIICICYLIHYLIFDGFRTYGKFFPIFNVALIIALTSFYLWHISNKPAVIQIKQNPFFWICLTLFLTNLINLFITLISDQLFIESHIDFVKMRIIVNCIDGLSQLVFCYAFTKSKYLKYL